MTLNPERAKDILLARCARSKKGITGYSLFLSGMSKYLKSTIGDSDVRRRRINDEWRALGDEGKKPWNEVAKTLREPSQKRKGHVSGWNLYTKAFMTKGVTLAELGVRWRGLSQAEKDEWKRKASGNIN